MTQSVEQVQALQPEYQPKRPDVDRRVRGRNFVGYGLLSLALTACGTSDRLSSTTPTNAPTRAFPTPRVDELSGAGCPIEADHDKDGIPDIDDSEPTNPFKPTDHSEVSASQTFIYRAPNCDVAIPSGGDSVETIAP